MTEIRVLYFEGCPNGQATFDLVRSVVEETGSTARVSLVEVEGPEQVEALRFLGSPTVQVNGIDIEPSRRNDSRFAFACRVYRSSEGFQGVPPTALVLSAVDE